MNCRSQVAPLLVLALVTTVTSTGDTCKELWSSGQQSPSERGRDDGMRTSRFAAGHPGQGSSDQNSFSGGSGAAPRPPAAGGGNRRLPRNGSGSRSGASSPSHGASGGQGVGGVQRRASGRTNSHTGNSGLGGRRSGSQRSGGSDSTNTGSMAYRLASLGDEIAGPVQKSFSCQGRDYGYYADVANNCEVYHVCVPSQKQHYSFFCNEGSIFDDTEQTCIRKSSKSCSARRQ